jgi:zinc/manganese transport system substrate-binding protein
MARPLLALAAAVAALTLAPGASAGTVPVVAAENFWGSIAAQLGGTKADAQSILVNPNVDPHSYEPLPSDARAFAAAKLAIVNGIGYDSWASQLLAANPVPGRVVVDAGAVLGLREGDNPHQWYSPANVERVAAAITAAYVKLDPADKAYFERQSHTFETKRLAQYHALIAQIRKRYRGVAVGYSESIFQPLGAALGLRLATPYSFAKAVAEGTEITAADRETVERQATKHAIKVWIYNSQNATPDVQQQVKAAKAAGIEVATVTETLTPAGASFQDWQVRQLQGIEQALAKATGK